MSATIAAAPSITAASTQPELVTIDFVSKAPIKLATIKAATLTDDGGFAVTGVNVASDRRHRAVTAVYSLAAPAGGWSSSQNGTYHFNLISGRVKNSTGGKAPALAGSFIVDIVPPVIQSSPVQISSVSQVTANSDAQPVIVTGSGFKNGLHLIFTDPSGNAIDETSFVPLSVDPSQFAVQIPGLTAAGQWSAQVLNPDGATSGQFAFQVLTSTQTSNPAITSISPATATPGHQSIVITGAGFKSGLTLTFRDPSGNAIDESQYVPLSVDPSQIPLFVPGVQIPGRWTAEVVNPDGKSSGQVAFQVQPFVPTVSPTITSVSAVTTATAAQPITIKGSGFVSGLRLTFRDPAGNVVDETSFVPPSVDSAQFAANIPAITTTGQWTAEIVNPDQFSSGQFSFLVQPASTGGPAITSVSPVAATSGRQPITIAGSGFAAGLHLTFRDPSGNAVDETTFVPQSVDPLQFSVQIPSITTAGQWTVEVVNPDGHSSGRFSVIVAPTVSSATPLKAKSGLQSLTVGGAGFENGLAVTVRDPSGAQFDSIDHITIDSAAQFSTMLVEITTPGRWTIELTNPDGGDSGQFPFEVTAS